MQIVGAPRRLALDASTYFTPYAGFFYSNGYRTIFRYLRRNQQIDEKPTNKWPEHLSRQELNELLGMDWKVGLFQRRAGSDEATRKRGEEVGAAASWNARQLGIPEGASILCDCEWDYKLSQNAQTDYLLGWGKAVSQAGDVPTLYVSTDLKFSSGMLYALPYFKGYFKSASYVPTVDVRGYQGIQSVEYKDDGGLFGLRCDVDLMMIDGLGDRMQVIAV
jgi:hypothetical protein